MNRTVLRTVLTFLTLFALTWNGFAQHPEAKRADRWYFGNRAGLDFSSGTAVAVIDGQLDSWESCASISDIDGNLLFYTDGDTIWDRNHNVMPNGTGLFGNCTPFGPNNSATQGVIIIPRPKSDDLFHVFTVDCAENLGMKGMNYSVVDLSLNGGLGDVTVKNQFLFAPSTEGMAATMNCTGDSVWVVGHDDKNRFYSYLITEIGINSIPAISIGGNVYNLFGQMKFSPNGKRFALDGYVYNFDFTEGKLLDSIFVNFGGYGLTFSPDSKKLYYSIGGGSIEQLDITFSNSADIMASYQNVYHGISNDRLWGMQTANDNKIYITNVDTARISTIDFPNNDGAAAGFNLYSVDLNGRKSQFTLPSFIENYFDDSYEPGCDQETEEEEEKSITIPNTFTPDDDGINDAFNIEISGYTSLTYAIYNRWGRLLKKGGIPIGQPGIIQVWDGTTVGNRVPDGVYYYTLDLTDDKGDSETKKGFIQIIK